MRRDIFSMLCLLVLTAAVYADSFGEGENRFELDFVEISAESNPNHGPGVVEYDYNMGVHEITNDQWRKFQAAYGPVAGSPTNAYDNEPAFEGADIPVNSIGWYEAAQFVNWLNTSTGHRPAYKFEGEQGAENYQFTCWDSADQGYNPENPFRNSQAHYYLPSADEWVKAGYWNGSSLQTYALPGNFKPRAGEDSNYNNPFGAPRHVGAGARELNGTYDMMGNVWEWVESPYEQGDFSADGNRQIRGGAYSISEFFISSSGQLNGNPVDEYFNVGFRVAAVAIPEPATALLLLAGLMIRPRRNGRRQ